MIHDNPANFLAEPTFMLVQWLISFIYSNLLPEPGSFGGGTPSFSAEFAYPGLSYEGIILVAACFTPYFWMYRKILRFSQAFWLFAAGLLAIWVATVIHIVAVIVIGTSFSREMSLELLRPDLRWLILMASLLGTVTLSHRLGIFISARPGQPDARKSLPPLPVPPQTSEATTPADRHSYNQILKSSTIIGGSTLINIGIGIVRTKAMAILLGPGGVGLMGLYGSLSDLALSIAGMGINNSGVRQIAEAKGSSDKDRIALTVAVLRRASILLGLLGAGLMFAFSKQISTLTFGSDEHAEGVALLSLAVLFGCISGGQLALIQGMRRIGDLAKVGIIGTVFGMIISVLLVYFLHEDGVVPSLVSISAMAIITSWWYSRKVEIQPSVIKPPQMRQEAATLLKLGFAFMASGLMMMGATYAVRILVLRTDGFDAAGYYQSAWALGGLYVGFILQAMGADFYPRLTAVAKDNDACNRLANEQAQVSLLLAGPGVLATLTFAPLVIALFYTPKFYEAVEVLRWLCLGMTLRIISWPIGFIILAKGAQKAFFWSELAWTIVYVGLAWICVNRFGLNGAGIAFFGSYIFHCVLIYVIVGRLSGFRWSNANIRFSLSIVALISIVFCGFYILPPVWTYGIGAAAVIISGIHSFRTLLRLVSLDHIPKSIRKLLIICSRLIPRRDPEQAGEAIITDN